MRPRGRSQRGRSLREHTQTRLPRDFGGDSPALGACCIWGTECVCTCAPNVVHSPMWGWGWPSISLRSSRRRTLPHQASQGAWQQRAAGWPRGSAAAGHVLAATVGLHISGSAEGLLPLRHCGQHPLTARQSLGSPASSWPRETNTAMLGAPRTPPLLVVPTERGL